LDGDPLARPAVNIFVESKAPWHEIDESIASVSGFGTEEFWRTFEPGRAYLEWHRSRSGDA
jgi:hypothetical protein